MEKRVVITGMGIWACIGKNTEEVTQSLREGRSGIGLDPARRELGYISSLTGIVEQPNLKGVLDRRQAAVSAPAGRICLHGHRRGDAQRRNGRGLPGGERGGNHLRQRQQCGAGDRGDRHHPRQAEHGDGRLGQYFPVDELDRDDEPLGDLQPAGHQPHALGGLRQRVARPSAWVT